MSKHCLKKKKVSHTTLIEIKNKRDKFRMCVRLFLMTRFTPTPLMPWGKD